MGEGPRIRDLPTTMLCSRLESDPAGLAAFATRLDRDFHVLIERRKHKHQLFHRHKLELAAQELRQVGLLHVNQFDLASVFK